MKHRVVFTEGPTIFAGPLELMIPGPDYSDSIFSFANGTLPRNVCSSVSP
jgi:hypothetical protein